MPDTPDPLGAADGNPRTDASSGPVQPRDADLVGDIGLSEDELTPNVRAALDTLARENDRLRQSLAAARNRVAYYEKLADRDSLVPAFNRRAFMRELRRTISYGTRYGTVNSVLYFDVNGMKGLNDTLGHAAGDAALTQIARVLDANLRESDTIGRLGGDEFGVILVNADAEHGRKKAAALAAAIAGATLRWEGWAIPLETAWGTHTIADDDTALSALYAADQSMYRQKEELRAWKLAERSTARRAR